jgi:hypothetical protein
LFSLQNEIDKQYAASTLRLIGEYPAEREKITMPYKNWRKRCRGAQSHIIKTVVFRLVYCIISIVVFVSLSSKNFTTIIWHFKEIIRLLVVVYDSKIVMKKGREVSRKQK